MFEAVEELVGEHAGLEKRLADPAIHTDQREAMRLNKRYAELTPIIATYRAWKQTGDDIGRGLGRVALQSALPAGAARNALDCAFIDLESKRANRPAHELLGVAPPRPRLTAYTISFGPRDQMAAAAAAAATRPLLKIKLGGVGREFFIPGQTAQGQLRDEDIDDQHHIEHADADPRRRKAAKARRHCLMHDSGHRRAPWAVIRPVR